MFEQKFLILSINSLYDMIVPDIIIAIDGYSSTGKSSFAKLVANAFSFLYLDSGALYRAVTLFALRNNFIAEDGTIDTQSLKKHLNEAKISFRNTSNGSRTYLGEECIEQEIRTLEVSGHVSPIAALPMVRDFVDKKLREFGKAKRIVMDGRDIGTTVFPDAEIKIFMTADQQIRAQRRFDELKQKGENPVFEDVIKNLLDRDYIDSHRETSPLVQAKDAFVLDNSHMSMGEEVAWLQGVIQGKLGIKE